VDSHEVPEEDDVQSPYDRFTPRSLLDRHPSLLRCAPQKVTTSSFMAASKFSVSTPNLTKLIQEDSMFEEERKKHEVKLQNSKKKRLQLSPSLTPTKDRKKLSVPDQLKSNGGEEKNSDEYRQRFQSYNLSREESFGAVHRRPKEERRAQYPISMAFASGFMPVAVDIDIDGDVDPPMQTPIQTPEPDKGIRIL